MTSIRDRFPGLRDAAELLLDNAGGAQVPDAVIDAVAEHYRLRYVQLGADYARSVAATTTVEHAREFVRAMFGAGPDDPVVLGPSTSELCARLADAHRRAGPGERPEIVVAESNHESNRGPWRRLAAAGFTVRPWHVDATTQDCPLEELDALLGPRTRLVAVPHVSNLLGRIEPLEEITRRAHAVGAQVVADGVAFAPHRAMDLQRWGVDVYLFSTYKVFGPHMAAMAGTPQAFAGLVGDNHDFIDPADVVYRFELGGTHHESCAGMLGLARYLNVLAGEPEDAAPTRAAVTAAFAAIEDLERAPQEALADWLRGRDDLRAIGPLDPGTPRVPTFSFVSGARSSADIARAANARGLGIRFGHFYAPALARALGLEPEDGVVRCSLVHYNTVDDVARLTAGLEEILATGR